MNDVVAIDVLQTAMILEQTGKQFYLKAAQTTEDVTGKEMFAVLANDESSHFELIKRQYQDLVGGKSWLKIIGSIPGLADLPDKLFPPEKQVPNQIINKSSNAEDALLFGINIEIRSYDLYRKSALESDDPVAKEFFEYLASQESYHYDVLMIRYDFQYGPLAWYP